MTESQSQKKVLILAANPIETTKLRLDEEIRVIKEARQKTRNRDSLDIFVELAVNFYSNFGNCG
ncbi:hypothetical protein [Hydrocoleum sp. CS-953]|uniref:hypothetical protein n=1 Tax=Microcoleaceae TaxID=1892252 RepID=UPI000B9B7326|nr:hypothetical protein [Hydrocoleum sp. CS-953]OZH52731.1 hypothetical protein AFK68_22465 [Hydrocoleum sp. CS-953]